MPPSIVGLPRDQAIRLAKYEQASLLLRAKASTKCPQLWRDAALHAGLVVQYLRKGDDGEALRHAHHVAPRWKKAADCEGWPTPMGNYVSVGDEESKLDLILKNQADESRRRKFTLTVGVIGALIAAARLGIVAIPLIKAVKRRPSSEK